MEQGREEDIILLYLDHRPVLLTTTPSSSFLCALFFVFFCTKGFQGRAYTRVGSTKRRTNIHPHTHLSDIKQGSAANRVCEYYYFHRKAAHVQCSVATW